METDKMNSVTAQEMRGQISDLLNRAAYAREGTLVTRQGKAVAVLVPVGEWEDYLRLKAATETHGVEEAGQKEESRQGSADSGNGRE